MSKSSKSRVGREPKSQHTPKSSGAAKAGARHAVADKAQAAQDALRAAASIKEGPGMSQDPAGAGQVAMQQAAPMAGQPSDSDDAGQ